MQKKEFLINAVRMIDLNGSINIPSVLFYKGKGSVLIGSRALAEALGSGHKVMPTSR